MATGDTALWLHNKLGSTDDLWSGATICSQLTQSRLGNIQACYHALQPHVKVKLMLSFLHIPRRNVEQWKIELEDILLMAANDTEQWVSMVAEILRPFPATGTLNLELDESNNVFAEVNSDLNKVVKRSSNVRMLPLECQFLNKTALVAATGAHPQPVKHFALKRKPKSAILRAELLQKSSEVANNKKNNMSNSVPIKVRSFAKKMDDATPLKGLPSRTPPPSSGFRSPPAGLGRINSSPLPTTPLSGHRPTSVRKEGGVKLLEIEALPVGSKEAKRRRKIADMEAAEQQKKEKEAAAAAITTTVAYTPDYAAGLVSPAPAKIPAIVTVGTSSTPVTTPTASYVPATSSRLPTPTVVPFTASPVSSTTLQARENLQQQLQQQLGQSQIRTQTASVQPQPVNQSHIQIQPNAQPMPLQPQPQLQFQQQQQQQQTQQQQLQQQQQQTIPQVQPQNQPKKGLSLTREQMLEAQEMFRTSNKVTRPEKALILGFMAGSRENPCPQQGHVLSIRLSENKELLPQTDGSHKTVIADTFFQMNYETGEWKRIKKHRECEDT